jgi:DNA-binding transcriptional MerR regulator
VQKPKALSIGQLGKAVAIKVETIRYYEQIGLLPVPARTSGNYRSYADDHVRRLGFIRRARELGFSIAEIRELLGLAEQSDSPCEKVDDIVARHLATTEKKIATLKKLRTELRNTLAACKGGRIAECRVVQALSASQPQPRKSGSRRSAAT